MATADGVVLALVARAAVERPARRRLIVRLEAAQIDAAGDDGDARIRRAVEPGEERLLVRAGGYDAVGGARDTPQRFTNGAGEEDAGDESPLLTYPQR